MIKFEVAEIFDSIQGEGVHTGVPMTFIRFVGCSVGKTICHHCDTDFDRTYPWKGGGEFTIEELRSKIKCHHVCFTGGEPLNQEHLPLLIDGLKSEHMMHIETSGTVFPDWLGDRVSMSNPGDLRRYVKAGGIDITPSLWVTVAPKPGYLQEMIYKSNEVKVIVPGLGSGAGWPGLYDALRWAGARPVFLQPRNDKERPNHHNMALCMELVMRNPSLRLSAQLHKYISVR
jgi:7-carboxy-7-deazaguanine synthase